MAGKGARCSMLRQAIKWARSPNQSKTNDLQNETKDSLNKPSRMTDGRYAVLQETNGEEHESWLYFIRVEGNEENLNHLQTENIINLLNNKV
jgi:hypothetical protein